LQDPDPGLGGGQPGGRGDLQALRHGGLGPLQVTGHIQHGPNSRCKSANNRTAGTAATSAGPAPSNGTDGGGTGQAASPGTPSGSRLVTSTRSPGALVPCSSMWSLAAPHAVRPFPGHRVRRPSGSTALPTTGALVKVNGDGTFTAITDGLDRPTSLEFIGTTAYVVTLGGEIWKIDGVSGPPYGATR
jgi:hypothetical protein